MRFDILTIFPDMFVSPMSHSILKRAQTAQKITLQVWNIRDAAEGVHAQVDDAPYGGGAGMVFKPEPLVKAIEVVPTVGKRCNILLTPRGKLLQQIDLEELLIYDQLVLVCGRYEGVDQRAIDLKIDKEISVGDYILTGGEIPAMILVDGVTRLIPGVLGCENSTVNESFAQGLLEHPHYTRPEIFRGQEVPAVLRSGNHREIEAWRRKESLRITQERRPDLLSTAGRLKELQKEKESGS